MSAACTVSTPAVKLEGGVIEGEAYWQDEVLIDGVVTVKKTGVLTIAPGTRVSFVPRDDDGDGIGDSELLVEGNLQAVGTAEKPIIFTSAASEPQASDWKYLYIDFGRGESVVDHVISEYAYSGLQVHFSRARVTNSVFRNNVDGLRFSTVNLLAAGNRMHDNTHGLRYEERNSRANIYYNDISDNDIGIFVVTRSTDSARIERNNIANNSQYNVKMGWQQQGDVTLPNNWWGGLSGEELQKTFLDGSLDASLGSVSAPDPLQQPVDVVQWQEYQGAVQ
jgi:hypothetical protein